MGVILYQEQVMRIAIEVGGFTAAESDGFRRAMGTWRSSREMEKLHQQFVEGCLRQPGMTEEIAEELFRQVAAFASFGFAKIACGGVRPDGLRIGVPEAVLPGPVPGRADQRPADGLLPGRGPRQRRQAPRRGRPAGRHQRVGVQDHDRMGGPAGRAAARGGAGIAARPERRSARRPASCRRTRRASAGRPRSRRAGASGWGSGW